MADDHERDNADGQPVLPAQTGQNHADGKDRNVRERCSEVGFCGDESHGDEDHAAQFQKVANLQHVGLQFR